MTARARSGWLKRTALSAIVLMGCAGAAPLASAQTRTLATLSDVPVYVPAPYHPHIYANHAAIMAQDSHPYYGGVYWGIAAHHWH